MLCPIAENDRPGAIPWCRHDGQHRLESASRFADVDLLAMIDHQGTQQIHAKAADAGVDIV